MVIPKGGKNDQKTFLEGKLGTASSRQRLAGSLKKESLRGPRNGKPKNITKGLSVTRIS